MKIMSGKFYIFIITVIITFDQITKYLIMNYLSLYTFNSFLSIDLVLNRGISWGLLHSESMTVFAYVNSGILVVIAALIVHTFLRMKQHHSIIPEVVVFAGAVSNYMDRCFYQGVVDFISVSYGGWSFPVFNFADIFIVGGVTLMLLLEWRKR